MKIKFEVKYQYMFDAIVASEKYCAVISAHLPTDEQGYVHPCFRQKFADDEIAHYYGNLDETNNIRVVDIYIYGSSFEQVDRDAEIAIQKYKKAVEETVLEIKRIMAIKREIIEDFPDLPCC